MGCFTFYIRSIMALCVLFTLDTPLVSGFTTQTCTHGQIETKLKSTLNCVMKPESNRMDAFLKMVTVPYAGIRNKLKETKTTDLCGGLDELTSCFTNNIGTCFDQKINSDFTTMMEYIKYYNMELYYNLKCNMVGGLKKDEIYRKANLIIPKFNDHLKSMFTFDKECSADQLTGLLGAEFLSPETCFTKHVLNIKPLYDFIYMSSMNILNDKNIDMIERLEIRNTTSIPVCKTVIGILSTCLQENKCFSQPEMNFIRDFFATFYRIAMPILAQLSGKFGGMSKLMDVARVDVDDMHGIARNTTFNEKKTQIFAKLMDLTIEDYKTDSCQKGIKQFTTMVDEKLIPKLALQEGDDANGSYVIILVLVLSFVVIIIVAMLGWIFYAYRNPTTRSGQILINATAKTRNRRLSVII